MKSESDPWFYPYLCSSSTFTCSPISYMKSYCPGLPHRALDATSTNMYPILSDDEGAAPKYLEYDEQGMSIRVFIERRPARDSTKAQQGYERPKSTFSIKQLVADTTVDAEQITPDLDKILSSMEERILKQLQMNLTKAATSCDKAISALENETKLLWEELKEENKLLWKEVRGLKKESKLLWEEVRGLKEENKLLWEEVRGLKEENKLLWKEVRGLKEETHELKEKQHEMKQEICEIRQEFRERKREICELKEDMVFFQDKLTEHADLLAQLTDLFSLSTYEDCSIGQDLQ